MTWIVEGVRFFGTKRLWRAFWSCSVNRKKWAKDFFFSLWWFGPLFVSFKWGIYKGCKGGPTFFYELLHKLCKVSVINTVHKYFFLSWPVAFSDKTPPIECTPDTVKAWNMRYNTKEEALLRLQIASCCAKSPSFITPNLFRVTVKLWGADLGFNGTHW